MPITCVFAGCGLKELNLPRNGSSDPAEKLKKQIDTAIDHLICKCGVTRFIFELVADTEVMGCDIIIGKMKRNPELEAYCLVPFLSPMDRWKNANGQYENIRRRSAAANYENLVNLHCLESERIKSIGGWFKNQYFIEECDYLLAVWNGIGKSRVGGIVHMAQKAKRPQIIIEPHRYAFSNIKITRTRHHQMFI